MSTPINDGGPAFPYRETENSGQYWHHYGMTLRDYFAGQALAGVLSDWHPTATRQTASQAYEIADAMLAAREAKP